MDAQLFGEHDSKITIELGDKAKTIEGRINRTANKNKTPRIMAGETWVHKNYKEGDTLTVTVINNTTIRLT